MNTTQSVLERDVAAMIVSTLNLENVKPEEIDPAAPLFGTGLGLDSIDALELALEISKRYGFQIRSDDEDNLTTLCAKHHLRGVHAGIVRIVGRAPDALRFDVGPFSFAPGELATAPA